MKPANTRASPGGIPGRISLSFVFILFLFTLSACMTTVYFSEPQPENARDLRKFPSGISGTWVNFDTTETSFTAYDTLIISMSTYREINNGMLVHLHPDSLAADTNWSIRDSIFYEDKDDKQGFPIINRSDSMFILIGAEEITKVLGDSVRLRRIARNRYILSLNKDNSRWWSIYLFEVSGDGTVYGRKMEPSPEELDALARATGIDSNNFLIRDFSRFGIYPEPENKFYKNNKFTELNLDKKTVNRLAGMGGFRDTCLILRPSEKIGH